MNGWIKVSERLPDKGQRVLLKVQYDTDPVVGCLASYYNNHPEWEVRHDYLDAYNLDGGDTEITTDLSGLEVTHWQPLPPLPNEE